MHGGNLTLNELTKFTNNIKSQKSRFHANPDFRHSVDHRRTPSIASSARTNNFQLQWVINVSEMIMALGKIRGVQLAKASSQSFGFSWLCVAEYKGWDVVEGRCRNLLTNLTAAARLPSVGECQWTAWHWKTLYVYCHAKPVPLLLDNLMFKENVRMCIFYVKDNVVSVVSVCVCVCVVFSLTHSFW